MIEPAIGKSIRARHRVAVARHVDADGDGVSDIVKGERLRPRLPDTLARPAQRFQDVQCRCAEPPLRQISCKLMHSRPVAKQHYATSSRRKAGPQPRKWRGMQAVAGEILQGPA